jgi:hypothetical protein
MRRLVFTILSLALSTGSLAGTPESHCLLDPTQMPESWRPPADLRQSLNPAPWSQSEAKDADYAIETGLNEMIGYFERKPSAVQNLWDDSVEALIQVTYASANTPEFDARASGAARKNLTALVTPYLERDPASAICDEFEALLPLALFAHKLFPANDRRTDAITKRTNAAYRDCGSLEEATGHRLQKVLADKNVGLEVLFELHLWTLWFIEAELYPDIELPAETGAFGPALWKYFETYRFPRRDDFEAGAWDEDFIVIADLATHIVHIPTGVHRFPLYVEDSPNLYRFHREHFYTAMQLGEPDLFASFIDTLRQYGCTPENDVQVRDGTRYLLRIFSEGEDSWMDYRKDGETDANMDDYGLIHYPWTALLGIRDRNPEQPKPGTYGGIVRRWLPQPR